MNWDTALWGRFWAAAQRIMVAAILGIMHFGLGLVLKLEMSVFPKVGYYASGVSAVIFAFIYVLLLWDALRIFLPTRGGEPSYVTEKGRTREVDLRS